MKIVSNRILTLDLGDSKISIHKLTGSDKLILSVQNVDAGNLAILSTNEDEYEVGNDGESELGQYVIIDKVKEEEIRTLWEELSKKFPRKKEE